MMQARTVEAVERERERERATVYVKCGNSTVITKTINKIMKKLNKVVTPLFGVEYKRQTIT